MQKIILAFNFTPERLQALKLICMMLRVQLRAVERSEMLQPVGYLAGVKDVASVDDVYEGEGAAKEMLLMCAFNRPDMDRLLAAIKKGELKQIELKAMLTPYNCMWSAVKLQEELDKEHAFMHDKKNAAKPKHKA